MIKAEEPDELITQIDRWVEGFHGSWLNGAFEGSADGAKDKGLAEALAPMVAGLRTALGKVGATSPFVQSIATGFTKIFSADILQKMAGEIVKTVSPVSVKQTTLT